jgi:Ras-related protein Rab-8A
LAFFGSQHADVHVNFIMLGNKCDMEEERIVTAEEGQSLADEIGCQFFETSAKNDSSIIEVSLLE